MKKEIFGYKSFEDLFNQYFEDLMRFVYGYVGNEEVARDIVHDVFLTFWNHREHLDFSWSLKSYLFTLSRNYALNYLRHQKVVAQNEEALMREMESIQDEWEDYDQEIERLKPLMALGGYIPCPDHRIAPDAKFELVQYYCEKMQKAVR